MLASLALLALAAPYSALASRVLALTDAHSPSASSSTFHAFFNDLQNQGHDVLVKDLNDPAAAQLLDERSTTSFDHLVLFAPSTKQSPSQLTPQSLTRRINSPSNPIDLLLVLPPSATELWRDYAREFEVDPDDRGQVVVDYFSSSSPSSSDDPSTLSLSLASSSAPSSILSPATREGPPVLYRGSGHLISRSPLLTPVLYASPTAFSTDADSKAPPEEVRLAGSSAGLVSAFQARNNKRVVIAGSEELFSDAFAEVDGTPTGNPSFLHDLTAWTFHRTGVLRVESSSHLQTEAGVVGSPTYRVGTNLTYTLTLLSAPDVPHPLPDLQASFTMLDPHLRVPLLPVSHSPSPSPSSPGLVSYTYSATFAVPDRHGVFTLSCLHRRAGLETVEDKHTVSVVPLRHNEYERFITGAVPYYTGAASVSVAFVVFVCVWVMQS
ncbi:hypothetical protein JCM8547_001428 [Rhodosporidiobolus lusitaniae]